MSHRLELRFSEDDKDVPVDVWEELCIAAAASPVTAKRTAREFAARMIREDLIIWTDRHREARKEKEAKADADRKATEDAAAVALVEDPELLLERLKELVPKMDTDQAERLILSAQGLAEITREGTGRVLDDDNGADRNEAFA